MLDLNGGGLLTPNGEACDFVSITTIRIRNLDDTQIITPGGGSNSPAWANFPPIGPGGVLEVHRPDATAYAVTAGTRRYGSTPMTIHTDVALWLTP